MKRKAIKEAVRMIIQRIQETKEKDKMLELDYQGFKVTGNLYPMSLLLGAPVTPKVGRMLTEFVEVIQGVTWGGKGTEHIFDLSEQEVKELSLEREVIYKRIGGEDIRRWRIEWTRRYILFPYVVDKDKWSRAFKLIGESVDKPVVISDSLDFERPFDDTEQRVLQQDSSQDDKCKKILEHRIALGLIKYPNAATYLAQHYEQLKGRIFEEKTLQEYNKQWYEYHRPRIPIIIQKPKIVGPRLVKTARFALDTVGFLPRDSVIAIIPKQKSFEDLKSSLDKTLDRKSSQEEVLLYILAFLNSEIFDHLLREKVSKKRGGYPIIDERLLQKLEIPIPTRTSKDVVKKLLQLVKRATSKDCTNKMNEEINKLVNELYKIKKERGKRVLESFIK